MSSIILLIIIFRGFYSGRGYWRGIYKVYIAGGFWCYLSILLGYLVFKVVTFLRR